MYKLRWYCWAWAVGLSSARVYNQNTMDKNGAFQPL